MMLRQFVFLKIEQVSAPVAYYHIKHPFRKPVQKHKLCPSSFVTVKESYTFAFGIDARLFSYCTVLHRSLKRCCAGKWQFILKLIIFQCIFPKALDPDRLSSIFSMSQQILKALARNSFSPSRL
jgi:hypothetical protein